VFEVGREKFILLPSRASKRNFSNIGVDDLYGIAALEEGTVVWREESGREVLGLDVTAARNYVPKV
jgi:hypothetical protein